MVDGLRLLTDLIDGARVIIMNPFNAELIDMALVGLCAVATVAPLREESANHQPADITSKVGKIVPYCTRCNATVTMTWVNADWRYSSFSGVGAVRVITGVAGEIRR